MLVCLLCVGTKGQLALSCQGTGCSRQGWLAARCTVWPKANVQSQAAEL